MLSEDEKWIVVFDEEGQAIRWGLASSKVIKTLMNQFVSIPCDTKEIAKIFCGNASLC